MPAIKITGFSGIAPKNSPELLPAASAQIAENCKLYSGDLIPYPTPHVVGSTARSETVRTLYGLRDPSTSAIAWLSWTTDVDIVTPAADDLNTSRIYYTGDGAPKVTTYALATSGAAPYPTNYYDLGLPLPTAVPTTVATAFSALIHGSGSPSVTITRDRDRSNNATISLNVPHNLKDGALVSITGIGDTTFNAITTVTVTSSTSFTYPNTGAFVSAGSAGSGTIDLGGQTQARSYVYTWYTPWGEESIGSEPSTALFIKEGQIVTVSNLPSAPPSGNTFIRGIRLYRTVATTTETNYFRLATLWFPNSITTVQRTSNVARVTFTYPHNLLEGDRFKISGCSTASFNITDGLVSEVIDSYTFTYIEAGSNVSSTAATGTLYYDVAESLGDTARYWGESSYSFTDDFNYVNLTNILATDNYAPPPEGLQGLTVVQNTFLAGFVGNDLYFSEPNAFHAWPNSYKRSFESNIIGLASVGGTLLVLTESYPYILDGSDPAVLAQAKLPSRYPCLNRKSIVETSSGVIYATHDGLVLWNPSTSAQLLTRLLYSSDTWNEDLNPSTLVGTTHKDTYLASHSAGSIVFDLGSKPDSPSFIDSTFIFSASWYDALTNILYVSAGTTGDVYHWDDLTQPHLTMRWKSKTFITKEYVNLGAARVVADYATAELPYTWDTTQYWETADQDWDIDNPLVFRLYINKQLKFETTRFDSEIFRLPNGYKSDTFEVEVESSIRVRAIYIGDTPTSLREA